MNLRNPLDISSEEAQLRSDLTDFYHLVEYFGWDEIIFNHISVRVPGPDHHYLVNPFGLGYDEIEPRMLVKVDTEGRLVEDNGYKANPAGFALHGVIHANRPDAICVAHAHTLAMSAVANKAQGFSHDNFYGAQLTGRIGYHDFEGITLYAEEKGRMLASLGDKDVLVLRNHGVAVCGPDIPSTFMLLWIVERAAQVQMLSQAMQGDQIMLSDAVRQQCVSDAQRISKSGGAARMLFDASVRRMRRDRRR
ncbi:class II aldolase/adducin family protein [Flavisphingomonas formosensis]|uniref:class II aldolase/adducin family protein n=1 Tax=Flavisphingomonas formosensis TaxID=861534 RepID=UPI0012F8C54E|nr:class II aldolase/adducin family protein [Sphingomonas formosensis]